MSLGSVSASIVMLFGYGVMVFGVLLYYRKVNNKPEEETVDEGAGAEGKEATATCTSHVSLTL